MTLTKYKNLEFFSGSWISKKSIYLLKKKEEYQYEEFININSSKCYLNYKLAKKENYLFQNQITFNSLLAIQKDNKLIKFYNINNKYSELLKINIKIKKYNLWHKEYIYSINQNLKISISFLKNQNKYIAIIFTSYIKVSN